MTFDGLASGTYRCITADPPWAYPLDQRRAAAREHYSVMSTAELCSLPVAALAHPDGAALWLWVTNRALAAGWHVRVLEAWEFAPQTIVTWAKPSQPGVGRLVRSNTEHVVLAVRGSVPSPAQPAMSSWFVWPRVHTGRFAHSRKPASFGDLVEQVSPGPYCELFARATRLGWDSWGLGYEGQVSA